jgi:hypothetical protein
MQVNLLAVLFAALSAFVIGGIWYGPLFGKAWMDAHGFTEAMLRDRFNPVKTYGITFLLSVVTAYTLAMFLGAEHNAASGAGWGLMIGAVWVGGSIATNYQFEGTSNLLLMINAGYHAVRFAAMGAILGGMG